VVGPIKGKKMVGNLPTGPPTTGKKIDANDRGCDETNKEMGDERPCLEWTYVQK
jgi:hypothetical protein